MPWGSLLLCGWPGLARLWFRGHWPSLVIAIGFSILLNLAMISSFLWPWSLGATFPFVAWPMILIIWFASARAAYRSLPALMQVPGPGETRGESPLDTQSDTLFLRAQDEYLMGHWDEAKLLLLRRLEKVPRDVEARLQLATLFRHQRKLAEATHELDNIECFDQAINWSDEIRRERELIELIREDDSNRGSYDDASDDDLSSNFNDGFVQTSQSDSNMTSLDGDEIVFGYKEMND